MLAGSPFALLAMAEQSALTHHERWDGSGYPGRPGRGRDPDRRTHRRGRRRLRRAHSHTAVQAGLERSRRDHRDDGTGGTALRPAGSGRLPRVPIGRSGHGARGAPHRRRWSSSSARSGPAAMPSLART